MKLHKCIDCTFAEWERTPKGNIMTSQPGKCKFPMPPVPMLPAVVNYDFRWPPSLNAIWVDYEYPCPVFKERPNE